MTPAAIRDYSQRGEQHAFLAALAGIENGRLLEIGAWAAKDLSNSRALIEMGWSAVLIEPSPNPFDGLMREYGKNEKIQLVRAAVDTGRSLLRFHLSDDALSTTDEANYEKWKGVGGFYASAWIPGITFHDLYEKFGAFDFVSIDSEGTSVELLRSLVCYSNIQAESLPKCIVVEHDSRQAECLDAAYFGGYRVILETGENLVFAR